MEALKLRIKMSSLLLLMSILIGCNNDEPVTLSDFGTQMNKSVMGEVKYPIELSGFAYFPSYAVKEQRVIVSKEMFKLPVTATITHVSDQQYIMNAETVFINTLNYTFDIKITPSGILSFRWPETVIINGVEHDNDISDVLLDHDGAVKFGPVPEIFNGTFDGSKFYAESHFMMKQVQPGTLPFYSQLPLIDGPIMINYATFDLDVVQN